MEKVPPEILHRIQYFLNGKEAAQTTTLSKSWRSAWSTRPDLVFNQSYFPYCSFKKLSEFAEETMQRYADDLNLTIQTFMLKSYEITDVYVARELLVKAMKLGAVDLDITLWYTPLVLPDEVLRSETLARLSLTGSSVDLNKEVTYYSKLKTLKLRDVRGDLLTDLIPRCPFIEELTLESTPTTLDQFDNKLEYIYLRNLDIINSLFSPNKFRCLKELVIWGDQKYENISICIPSLERISIHLKPERLWRGEFEVPNLRKFEFHGSHKSSFDFRATRRGEWESDLHIRLSQSEADPSWFCSLQRLLKGLSLSRVSLSIDVCLESYQPEKSGDEVSTAVEVENLKLKGYEVSTAFLDSLFSICHPKFVMGSGCFEANVMMNAYLFELVCKRVVEVENVEHRRGDSPAPWMACRRKSILPWMTCRWKFVRFQLRWISNLLDFSGAFLF